MKLYLISDNIDTCTGMRLAGVEGRVAHTSEEVSEALGFVLTDPDIGVILVTEKLGQDFPSLITGFRSKHSLPLLVEIPDRHGTKRDPNYITAYVNEAIGLKL